MSGKLGHLGTTIKLGDGIDIHQGLIKLTVTQIKGKTVTLVWSAPREIGIRRVKREGRGK